MAQMARAPDSSGRAAFRPSPAQWIGLGLLSLAALPAAWVVGTSGFGSRAAAARVSDTVGVWIFSWGLVVMSWIGALIIAAVCFAAAVEARQERSGDPVRQQARG